MWKIIYGHICRPMIFLMSQGLHLSFWFSSLCLTLKAVVWLLQWPWLSQPLAFDTGFKIKVVFSLPPKLPSLFSHCCPGHKWLCHRTHATTSYVVISPISQGEACAQSPASLQNKGQGGKAHANCHLNWNHPRPPLLSLTKPFQGIGHCLVFHHVNEPPSQAKMWEDQEHRLQDIIDVIQLLKKSKAEGGWMSFVVEAKNVSKSEVWEWREICDTLRSSWTFEFRYQ